MSQTVHLVTGATSGVGLELARTLLSDPDNRLIVGARRPVAATELRALADDGRLTILSLDLSSLASTRAFADAVATALAGRPLASLAANAGVQIVGPRRLTGDGYEETFQANWLSHAALIEWLTPHMAPAAPVAITASGTHDPADAGARRFGFRGGIYPGIERVARGELDPTVPIKQQGMDLYATSKLCSILHVYASARRSVPGGPRWFAFDPGLMPGTGLARERSVLERWGWSNVLPLVARAIPGASTPRRSAATYARLLSGHLFAREQGVHLDFSGRETPSSADSRRADWQDEVAAFARRAAQAGSLLAADTAAR